MGPDYCTDPGAVCSGAITGGTCEACGGDGEPCCAGQSCDSPDACCAGDMCVADGDACPDDAGMCAGGGCEDGACGIIGGPCCDTGLGCTESFSICGPGTTCIPCGGLDQPCCGGECASPYECGGFGTGTCQLP
jgi:hypothetical protein